MDFDGGAAVGAGLLAGAAMSMLLYMGIAIMPGQMKMNLFRMLGTMMFADGSMAYVVGAMMHAMMSIVFALIHVAFFTAFDLETSLAAWGIVFGLAHWMVSGMGLGMMPMTCPPIFVPLVMLVLQGQGPCRQPGRPAVPAVCSPASYVA